MKQRNLKTVHLSVEAREAFNCNGTLTGETADGIASGTYQLPAEYRAAFAGAADAPDAYVVRSYGTPIAWYANGEWTVPPVKYSQTTSRHLSSLRLYRVGA